MGNVGMNDPFWELSNHISPDTILLILDLVEDWVVNEQHLIDGVMFLTNNFGVLMDEIFELITDIEGELDNLNNCLPEYKSNSDSRSSIEWHKICSVDVIKVKLEQISHKVLEYDLNNE